MNPYTVEDNSIKNSRMELLRSLFPSQATQIHFAVVEMDITMLSVADILRNINTTFPRNSATRNAIADGTTAVAVLCRTDLIKPLSGIILVVCNDASVVKVKSKNYVVAGISESSINDNDSIGAVLDDFTSYLIQNYGSDIPTFEKFYSLFIYDAYEMEDM